MYNYKTVWEAINDLTLQVNEVLSSALFTTQFLLNVLNDAMAFIYWFHKWSWNVVKEEKEGVEEEKNINIKYPILEVLVVKVNWKQYKQVEYFDDRMENSFMIVNWDNTISFKNPVSWKIEIVYRKWYTPYTINDLNKILDIPFFLNDVLTALMAKKILPLWLWEWAGQLLVNYMNDALNQLNLYKQIDTYAEPKRELYPKSVNNGNRSVRFKVPEVI